ncbi:hypothetical protein [Aquabacterium sp. OR-4]|uniref:hypothetical protein n=1 Tax=Aquabacterium sp. OR-4 TaxID=2978127 RepID=UPI0021B21684|nr:hypothetical protein [Aquabacterium sp. OR-4]MDT7836442.1 hypothetical protein [Aquabacterium sp. OR-4]
MIHLILAALGVIGLARALYCAWQMDGPAAGVLRRASNAAMGAGSVALLWAAWAGRQ